MDPAIMAAVIGALATLAAAIFPAVGNRKRKVREQEQLESATSTPKAQDKAQTLPVLVDYSRLEGLLKNSQWREADQETAFLMLKICDRVNERVLTIDDLKNFPCQELHEIDRLWTTYSKDQFGFSIQDSIWRNLGGDIHPGYPTWCKFGDMVCWRQDGDWIDPYLNLDKSSPGLLPWAWGNHLVGVAVGQAWFIFTRLRICS